MAAQHITLKDIAHEAGVSIMTVSRALRKHPNLAAETRSRILEVAERLGYRPNPMVSALMRYRRTGRETSHHFTLGYITNFPTRRGWNQPFLNQQIYEGATASANLHGYKLEEFWLRAPGMTAERLSKILYARNLVGLLIAPLPVPAGHLHLDWDKFSAVALGYSMEWPPLSRIVNQQYHAMRMALNQIQKLGYRRFGLAMRLMFDRSDHDHWTAAFLVDQHHRPPVEQVPLFVVPDPNWSQDAFKKWFLESRPGVVLSLHDEVLQWIKGMGLKVPQDVGFVHLNCPEASGRYAGIYHNGMAVGSAAVDYVVDMIHRNERGIPSPPKWILVEGNWQHGATLKGP